jgi:hypothetical protein
MVASRVGKSECALSGHSCHYSLPADFKYLLQQEFDAMLVCVRSARGRIQRCEIYWTISSEGNHHITILKSSACNNAAKINTCPAPKTGFFLNLCLVRWNHKPRAVAICIFLWDDFKIVHLSKLDMAMRICVRWNIDAYAKICENNLQDPDAALSLRYEKFIKISSKRSFCFAFPYRYYSCRLQKKSWAFLWPSTSLGESSLFEKVGHGQFANSKYSEKYAREIGRTWILSWKSGVPAWSPTARRMDSRCKQSQEQE